MNRKDLLDKMTITELCLFYSWFFGNDREYMTEHILENSENLPEELKRYNDQKAECKHIVTTAIYENRILRGFECNECGKVIDKNIMFPHLENRKQKQKELKPVCNCCMSGEYVKDGYCWKCKTDDVGYMD